MLLTPLSILALVFTGLSIAAMLSLLSIRPEASPQQAESLATSVIIPCKGDDGSLSDNLRSIVSQDHPAIEFVLVTATREDPAQAVFEEVIGQSPELRIKTVVAGLPTTCSQQNNNQIKGVEAADPDSRILVIMDSDGRSDRRFIAKLTAPLADPAIGASSGFRWYSPDWSSLPRVLRTAWNAGGFAFLVNPRTRFVWGGAMAVRREVFEACGIGDVWAHALSDDMTMSKRLKERGYQLAFVPECIVESREEDTFRSLIHWTNRQTLVTRFYNRPFWLIALLLHGVGNLLGWGLLLTGLLGTVFGGGGTGYGLALFAGGLWIAHFWLIAAMLSGALESMLSRCSIELGPKRWLLVLVAPLASLLQGLNSFASLLTRRIRWAGVTYRIQDERRMVVE
ncbi:MAG: glycosyltransferase family 2 protein [Phycisphaeraceae bacterium]|nr:glycosyltransferase family 2 protein [Phycisphaeraceae bacterium]